jgi:hypothetical protein
VLSSDFIHGDISLFQSLWGSWLVKGPNYKFFFAGDTGYCEEFKKIGKRYGPITLAAIPIGAYDPRYGIYFVLKNFEGFFFSITRQSCAFENCLFSFKNKTTDLLFLYLTRIVIKVILEFGLSRQIGEGSPQNSFL